MFGLNVADKYALTKIGDAALTVQSVILDYSRASNIALLLDWSSKVRFRFWFNPTEYFHQKGFIPLSRVPSFFEK